MVNDKLNTGETVSAVLRKVQTGEKQVTDEKPKYKVEVKITNLDTGEIHSYEVTR